MSGARLSRLPTSRNRTQAIKRFPLPVVPAELVVVDAPYIIRYRVREGRKRLAPKNIPARTPSTQ